VAHLLVLHNITNVLSISIWEWNCLLLCCSDVSTGWQGTCPPRFQAKGTVSPTFLSHNDAVAGFRSQSLGLPAYACKTGSSTAIKLAPRMHLNLPFWAPNFMGRGIATSSDPSPVGRGIPPPTPFPSAPRSSLSPWFVPHFFKPWIRPRFVGNAITNANVRRLPPPPGTGNFGVVRPTWSQCCGAVRSKKINNGDSESTAAGCDALDWSLSHYHEKCARCDAAFRQNSLTTCLYCINKTVLFRVHRQTRSTWIGELMVRLDYVPTTAPIILNSCRRPTVGILGNRLSPFYFRF